MDALLLVRNVVVDTPDTPPVDTTNLGPVRVEDASGTLGWPGMQAIGLLANVLPTLPPAADPAVPPPPSAHFQPYPGAEFFSPGRRSPIIAVMHDRSVAVGCDRYTITVDKDVWGNGDVASYRAWQLDLGFIGDDADGLPGQESDGGLAAVPRGADAAALVREGSLAYLTHVLVKDGDTPAERRSEFMIHAFGPAGEGLAEQMATRVRTWDSSVRTAGYPHLTVHPAGTADRDLPDGAVLDKENCRLVFHWPDQDGDAPVTAATGALTVSGDGR